MTGPMPNTGFRISVDSTSAALSINDPYIVISGIAITNANASGEGITLSADGDNCVIANCLINDCGNYGIYGTSGSTGNYILNTLIYSCERGIYFYHANNTVANCTILASNTYGVYRQNYANFYGYNIYVAGSGTLDFYESGSNSGFYLYACASSDGSVDDYGEHDEDCIASVGYTTSVITNVTAGSEDGHLVAGSPLINEGQDLDGNAWWSTYCEDSGDGIDFEGDVRATWSIGADEYISIPVIQNYIRGQQQ